VLEWARHLTQTFGTSGALNALRYYEALGWISAEVRARMVRHLQGLPMEDLHSRPYDEPGTPGGTLAALDGTAFGAHAESLRYVARLADDTTALENAHNRAEMARREVVNEPEATPVAIADGGDR